MTDRLLQPLWDGTGRADDYAWWTKDNGEIVGTPYVRARIRHYLAKRWRFTMSKAHRDAVLRATAEDHAWLASRNGYTVAGLCRDAEDVYLRGDYVLPEVTD